MKIVRSLKTAIGSWMLEKANRSIDSVAESCMRQAAEQVAQAALRELDFDEIAARITDEVDASEIAERVGDNLGIDRSEVAEYAARTMDIESSEVAEKAADIVFEAIDMEEMMLRISWKLADNKNFLDAIAKRVAAISAKEAQQ
jgi:hypothetical protein